MNKHFAVHRDEEEVQEIKNDLPTGVTTLVDKRCSFGGLKYPDRKLYTVFAIMEKVFSKLTTPANFTMFGGMLAADLLQHMQQN